MTGINNSISITEAQERLAGCLRYARAARAEADRLREVLREADERHDAAANQARAAEKAARAAFSDLDVALNGPLPIAPGFELVEVH